MKRLHLVFTAFLTILLLLINRFSACFNELGWTALSVLDEQGRETILKNLFGT